MIYSILIYVVFILPIAISNYRKDGTKWLIVKVINIIFTLYIFALLAGNARRLFLGITDREYLILVNEAIWINVAFALGYVITSFYAIVQSIRLAIRNGAARKLFLIAIPFVWLFTGIDKYYAFISMYNETPTVFYVIINNIMNGLIWGAMLIFYSNSKVKAFYNHIE